jgi:hypothetical protein
VIFTGNILCAGVILLLVATLSNSLFLAIGLCAAIGFLGMTFPIIIAHARGFVPPHLAGRGVTLLNLFGIGGVGVLQFASGTFHARISEVHGVETAYAALFGLFGLLVLLGALIYLFSRDAPRS